MFTLLEKAGKVAFPEIVPVQLNMLLFSYIVLLFTSQVKAAREISLRVPREINLSAKKETSSVLIVQPS